MDLWIIGAGGLLGSALVRSAPEGARLFRAGPVPWDDPADATQALLASVERFAASRRPGVPWAIVWAAGTGVPATTPAELRRQSQVLLDVASHVASRLDPDGAFAFASSASVYGTSADDCDETTPPAPSPGYGAEKLWQEGELARAFAPEGGPRLAVARISTLYGPGQNLLKRQGLVSSMCMEAVRGGVITLHVPLDTVRDYVYVDDAARLVHRLLELSGRDRPQHLLRVVASHRPTTIGELARVVQSVVHRRTHIVQASVRGSGASAHLSVRSVDPELASVRRTPLVVGVKAVQDDVLRRYARGLTTAP